jgi:hypothetical protein
MAAGEQAGHSEFYRLSLAYDNFTNLLCESINVVGHSGMMSVSDSLRKRDMRKWFLLFIAARLPRRSLAKADAPTSELRGWLSRFVLAFPFVFELA